MKIESEVLEVLRRATFTPDSIKLNGQLDRKLYVKVNKALEAAAGSWNRKRGAHIFKQNPAEVFNLETGEVLSGAINAAGIAHAVENGNQSAIVGQFFPTPPDLARRMVKLADIRANQRILEPSAGTGNILQEIINVDPIVNLTKPAGTVTAIENDPRLAEVLTREFPLTYVRCADFLECLDERGFDRIVMNPPFTKGQDIKHILHAFEMLKPGGRLVAICGNGPRQNDKLRPFVEERGGTWEPLPADTFKESGTGVNTVLLVVDAPDEADDPRENDAAQAPGGFRIEFPMTGGAVTISRDASPLPGMAVHIDEQRKAAATKQGEALTEKFNRPPADLSAKAGDLERRAPLFRDTDASGQQRLF